jgi:hypothetical protein
MNEFLRGNFKPRKGVVADTKDEDAIDQFEREALRRLGGSITFVSRKKFVWDGEDGDGSGK